MGEKVVRGTAAWSSPVQGTDLPYDFVQVAVTGNKPGPDPELPVWHHGANPRQGELYSGELRCTLTALTPLFVGNDQVELQALDPQFQNQVERTPCIGLEAYLGTLPPNDRAASAGTARKKKICFPLMLGETGAVLIPGEGLKGMYRHAFGALMSAPMQNVDEATYSYRPNANPSTNGVQSRSYAGWIKSINLGTGLLSIEVIDRIAAIAFVRGAVPIVAAGPMTPGTIYPNGSQMLQKIWNQQGGRIRLQDGAGHTLPRDYTYLGYHFALDVNRAFMDKAGRGRGDDHPGVLVPMTSLTGTTLNISPGVIAQYQQTCQHLACENHGHAKRNKPPCAVVMPNLQVNDIIFCECRVVGNNPVEVISFGHNFRYRWMHLDTVTQRAAEFDGGAWVYERRPELTAHPDEQPVPGTNPQPPERLSAVRNLLGYVAKEDDVGMGGLRKLQDPYNRLAGRVSFNMAMERDADADLGKRFLNTDQDCLLFVHPAVEPKASFARTYVPGNTSTWGDGIATVSVAGTAEYWLQNSTDQFAGRKFYPHQMDTHGALPPHHYDLNALLSSADRADLTAHTVPELQKFLWSDQSSAARHVSRAGREFGFTVRFKYLRPWELAALAAVLNPDLLAQAVRDHGQGHLPTTHQFLGQYPGGFGLKLGRGRAQGMGSVRIALDVCDLWQSPAGKAPDWPAFIGTHLLPRLAAHDAVVRQWFEVLRLIPGRRTARPYLLHRKDEVAGNAQTIVALAQGARKQHAESSRVTAFVP